MQVFRRQILMCVLTSSLTRGIGLLLRRSGMLSIPNGAVPLHKKSIRINKKENKHCVVVSFTHTHTHSRKRKVSLTLAWPTGACWGHHLDLDSEIQCQGVMNLDSWSQRSVILQPISQDWSMQEMEQAQNNEESGKHIRGRTEMRWLSSSSACQRWRFNRD